MKVILLGIVALAIAVLLVMNNNEKLKGYLQKAKEFISNGTDGMIAISFALICVNLLQFVYWARYSEMLSFFVLPCVLFCVLVGVIILFTCMYADQEREDPMKLVPKVLVGVIGIISPIIFSLTLIIDIMVKTYVNSL